MHKTPALALAAVFAPSAGAAMARDDMKPANLGSHGGGCH